MSIAATETLSSSASTLGASVTPEGVRYRVWAPRVSSVDVELLSSTLNVERVLNMRPMAMGYFETTDRDGAAGDLYRFRLGAAGTFPDPASRYQPHGVHGPSQVVDPSLFRWEREEDSPRPSFRDYVIYELHIGTFTKEGTFRAAREKLPWLVELGFTAVELMPLAEFPGKRNWGYDGAYLFAPAHVYGTPDELREFIHAAHRHGIAVILDVVYNHFGPDGCYLAQFSDHYFNRGEITPWGSAINFSAEDALQVRRFYLENVRYWIDDFHVDAFRMDATHAIIDRSRTHILSEITDYCHSRGVYVIAEDERNDSQLITEQAQGGYGLDAVWADDFHHMVETALVEASVYSPDFDGSLTALAETLQAGWLTQVGGRSRPAAAHLPFTRFVFCILNHDQCGNRPFGERLNHLINPSEYRAASALLALSPYIPLFFMGQEFGSTSPFQYFTDHHPELGRLVEQGRLEEMRGKRVYFSERTPTEIPSPQARETFERSKLNWEETEHPDRSGIVHLHRTLLALRKAERAFRPIDRAAFSAARLDSGVLSLRYRDAAGDWLLLADLEGEHSGTLPRPEPDISDRIAHWNLILSTNEVRFGGNGLTEFDPETFTVRFHQAGALLFREVR